MKEEPLPPPHPPLPRGGEGGVQSSQATGTTWTAPGLSNLEHPPPRLGEGVDGVGGEVLPTWTALVLFALASRLLVVSFACVVVPRLSPPNDPAAEAFRKVPRNVRHVEALSRPPRSWVEPLYRYDAVWYADIATRGYTFEPGEESSPAFFPLLPLLMAVLDALGLDAYLAGVLVPNLFFVVGVAFFGRTVLRLTGDPATVWWTCLLLVSYPWSFFFSAPYTESLAFGLVAVAAWAWVERRPGLAALAAGLAATARITALAFPAGVLLEWGVAVMRGRPARHSAWLVALSGAAGLCAFYGYLDWKFGDFFLQLKSQAAWGRRPPGLGGLLVALFPGEAKELATVPYLLGLGFLALGVRAWVRYGSLWGTLVLAPVLQVLATGSAMSMERMVLSAFPGFWQAADLVRRVPKVGWPLVAAGLALQGFFLYRFGNWVFAG